VSHFVNRLYAGAVAKPKTLTQIIETPDSTSLARRLRCISRAGEAPLAPSVLRKHSPSTSVLPPKTDDLEGGAGNGAALFFWRRFVPA